MAKKIKKNKEIIRLTRQFNTKFEEMAQNCMLKEVEMSTKFDLLEKNQKKRDRRELFLKIALGIIIVTMGIVKGLSVEGMFEIMLKMIGA